MIEIESVKNDENLFEVCEIIRRAQESEYKNNRVLYNTKGLTSVQLKYELATNQGVCFCAFEGSKPVGTLSLFQEKKLNWYAQQLCDKTIKYVAVDPAHQGKRIATELIEYVKSLVDYDVLSVSTGEKNKNAIQLYERCGFILVNISRGPINNAYKFAYWKEGCPISRCRIGMHVLISRIKSIIKKYLLKSKVSPVDFQ